MKRKLLSTIVLLALFTANIPQVTTITIYGTSSNQTESTIIESSEELSAPSDLPTSSETESGDSPPSDTGSTKDESTESNYVKILTVGMEFTEETVAEVVNLLTPEHQGILEYTSQLPLGLLEKTHIGNHTIDIRYMDSSGIETSVSVLITVKGKPEIMIQRSELLSGETFTFEALGIKAFDAEDGDLTDQILLLDSAVPLNEVPDQNILDSFILTLSVKDSDGNETIETAEILLQEPQLSTNAVVENPPLLDITKTISGSNRFGTAVAISTAMYKSADTVIVVSSENFPDALSAGPLSRMLKAPILLTRPTKLSQTTSDEIKRLGATKAIILGGTGAVSLDVETMLRSLNLTTQRISGSNRFDTSIEVAKQLAAADTAILASGYEFADALTAGSFAAKNGYPILLTRKDGISANVLDFIKNDLSIKNILIIGGENAISSDLETTLRNMGKAVTRIAGTNRYNTSVEMAKYGFNQASSAVVASGLDFADALTAVPYAASYNLPILLTNGQTVNTGMSDFLLSSSIKYFHFIGGNAAVSEDVKTSMLFNPAHLLQYRVTDSIGSVSSFVSNGSPAGNPSGSGISLLDFSLGSGKNLNLRYSVSTKDGGWETVTEKGWVGRTGKQINGIIMELSGSDATRFSILYRTYTATNGWTAWTPGGTPSGSSNGAPVLSIEAKIVNGSTSSTRKISPEYGIVRANLNLRSGAGTNYPTISVIPNESKVKILSTSGLWAHVRYTDSAGKSLQGYAHTSYIDQNKAILTINGLENGSVIPTSDLVLTGDMAYGEGIKESKYYINDILVGDIGTGFLSSTSKLYYFDYPVQTAYRITVPKNLWIQNQINVLKVEMIGMDGRIETEVRYVMPQTLRSQIQFESYPKSLSTYLNIENAKTNPPPQVYSSGGWVNATKEQTYTAMNPSSYVSQDTYKYIFLDLSYQKDQYNVTAEELNRILAGRGVLHGMGEAFLKAAADFKVNPFYLIAHSIHETGNGNSRLALGQQMDSYHAVFGDANSELIPLSEEDQGKKWHNVYGIGAYDKDPILWGSEKAYREGWDTVEKAIYGGAYWIANGYIDRSPYPQNTLYKMRYNLKENMSHQYATDIMWAHNQSKTIKKQFDNMGVSIPLNFIIPVFGEIRN